MAAEEDYGLGGKHRRNREASGAGVHAARRTNYSLEKPHLHAPLHREPEHLGLRPVLRRVPSTRAHDSRPGPGGSYPGSGRADHGMPAVAGRACEISRIRLPEKPIKFLG